MADQSDQWLTIAAAAATLGITENAVRIRIRKGRLLASRDNHGRILVLPTSSGPLWSGLVQPDQQTHQEPRQKPTDAPEVVPLSAVREMLEAHQRASSEAIAAIQRQVEAERALWLERIDAAELRAERVEARLDQVLDELLAERRPWWWR